MVAYAALLSMEGAYLGIGALSTGGNSTVQIVNTGTVTSTGGPNFFSILVPPFNIFSIAIGAATTGPGSNIEVVNQGAVKALGPNGIGIGVNTVGPAAAT